MIHIFFKHIKAIAVLILTGSLLMTGVLVWKIEGRQEYKAQMHLRFTRISTETGAFMGGDLFSTDGFLSDKVLGKVAEDLALENTVEELRKNVTVTEYLEADKETQNAALLKDGKAPDGYTDEYLVTVTADSETEAYRILDGLLGAYQEWYKDMYIIMKIPDNPAGSDLSDTEYITALNLLAGECESLLDYLSYKMDDAPDFLSVSTGYSMEDLYRMIELESDSLEPLVSDIYSGIYAKDRYSLVRSYQEKIDTAQAEYIRAGEEAESLKVLMETYSEKLKDNYDDREVDAESSYYTVEEFVEEGNKYTGNNSKTTYDNLIGRYVDLLIQQHKLDSQISEYQMVVSLYSGESDFAGLTGIEAVTPKSEFEIASEIETHAERINGLYDKTVETSEDYRDYVYATHVEAVGSIQTYSTVNTKLYSILAVAFGMCVCGGALTSLVVLKKLFDKRGAAYGETETA